MCAKGVFPSDERRFGCLEAEVAGIKVAVAKDAQIAKLEDTIAELRMKGYVDHNMCGVVKGHPYLNPNQIADPYMGEKPVIATKRPEPIHVEVDSFRRGREERPDWDRWY